jgi:hypothetical protein
MRSAPSECQCRRGAPEWPHAHQPPPIRQHACACQPAAPPAPAPPQSRTPARQPYALASFWRQAAVASHPLLPARALAHVPPPPAAARVAAAGGTGRRRAGPGTPGSPTTSPSSAGSAPTSGRSGCWCGAGVAPHAARPRPSTLASAAAGPRWLVPTLLQRLCGNATGSGLQFWSPCSLWILPACSGMLLLACPPALWSSPKVRRRRHPPCAKTLPPLLRARSDAARLAPAHSPACAGLRDG